MGNLSTTISAARNFTTKTTATPRSCCCSASLGYMPGSSMPGSSMPGSSMPDPSIPESYICVGAGYNLLESPFISPEFMIVTNKIIEIDVNEVMNQPSTIFGQSTIITENSVSDVYKEFNSKLSVKGTYGAFSGSASTEFSYSSSDHEETAYTKLYAYFVKNRQSINVPESKYRFTDQFMSDLNGSIDPKALFNKYGTHLIKDIFLGGRLELNYTTRKTVRDTNASIKADVQASYAFVGGSTTVEYKEKASQLSARSDLNVKVVGGNSITVIGIEDLKGAYESWCNSLSDPKKCAPCGISAYDSLIPIWTFCKDTARRTQIENVFQKSATDIILPEDSYITDITVVSDKNENVAKAKCPPGYQRIDADLNEGAGGEYIYFCIKRGKRENAITNILCESLGFSQSEATIGVAHRGIVASYFRHGTDLNKGAGGDYLYLLYTRDTRYRPIRNITVYMNGGYLSEEWNGRMCYINTTETADLNKGAGGRYIYVGFKC